MTSRQPLRSARRPLPDGYFNGDVELPFGLIADLAVDEFVRDQGLRALTLLGFDKRIALSRVEQFLVRFDEQGLAPPEDFCWDGWMQAVGLLGLHELAPRVRAAFADERIHPALANERHFDEVLAEALERPDVASRLAEQNIGYIEDTT